MTRQVNGEHERSFFERVGDRLSHWGRSMKDEDIISIIRQDPEKIPVAYLPSLALASAAEYERLRVSDRVREASHHLELASRLTDYLYHHISV